jgi:glycosyltransferase involved in cell wall biosynthesis
MPKTSVIIPSHRDPYLGKTIRDLFEKAKKEIEIIVFLDEWNGGLNPVNDDRILYLHSDERVGMRHAINQCLRYVTGEYIMKCDSHCMFDNGFDQALMFSTGPKTISVPSRYHLDPDKWERFNKPLKFAYLKYPDLEKEIGFRTGRAKDIEKTMDGIEDEIIIFQGSCWFMRKSFMDQIGGLDEDMFGEWGMEAHELSMKAWLVHDGRVVRNTQTWYAHYKKTIELKEMRKNMLKNMKKIFSMDMRNDWPGQTKTFKWLIDKWPLFPGWDTGWSSPETINILIKKGYVNA